MRIIAWELDDFEKRVWNRKVSKLYMVIDELGLACSIDFLWDYYLEKYFVVMGLGQFCRYMRDGRLTYENCNRRKSNQFPQSQCSDERS